MTNVSIVEVHIPLDRGNKIISNQHQITKQRTLKHHIMLKAEKTCHSQEKDNSRLTIMNSGIQFIEFRIKICELER